MLVELGNNQPHDLTPDKPLPGPCLTSISTNLDDPSHTITVGRDVRDLALHLAQNPGLITHLPADGLFVLVSQVWSSGNHGSGTPTWVAVTVGADEEAAHPGVAAELQRQLAEFWSCPEGAPADLEDTHHTNNGPPGVGPTTEVTV